jgi:hypothetical protein
MKSKIVGVTEGREVAYRDFLDLLLASRPSSTSPGSWLYSRRADIAAAFPELSLREVAELIASSAQETR